MTVISWAGPAVRDRIGMARVTPAAVPGAPASTVDRNTLSDPSARVTLGSGGQADAVYRDPRAGVNVVDGRVWSSPIDEDDAISALMVRNRSLNSYNHGDQWRGLGGALLARFSQTGEGYSQTMVDDPSAAWEASLKDLSPEDQARWAATFAAKRAADLASVTDNASTMSLKIQTRSGAAVELRIWVDGGAGVVGKKVELQAAGAISPAERAAIGKLAEGLDRALEGLGQEDAIKLDLGGLAGYDRNVLSSIDLAFKDGGSGHQMLNAASLHLGDDERSVALEGVDGTLHLQVDADTSLGGASSSQRRAAIQQVLDRMDRAGDRGHAMAARVQQMKDAFQQFQSVAARDPGDADSDGDEPNVQGASAVDAANAAKAWQTPAQANAASQLSGLADFEAGFEGRTRRDNRSGTTHEAGKAEYQLSQKTAAEGTGNGGQSAKQTVSEQLSAYFQRAAGVGTMLDVRNGTHSTTRVRDSSTVTTLVDASADRVTQALRKTDEQRLKTVTDPDSRGTLHRQSLPSQRHLVEQLQ